MNTTGATAAVQLTVGNVCCAAGSRSVEQFAALLVAARRRESSINGSIPTARSMMSKST
jgi:hypothetical protein